MVLFRGNGSKIFGGENRLHNFQLLMYYMLSILLIIFFVFGDIIKRKKIQVNFTEDSRVFTLGFEDVEDKFYENPNDVMRFYIIYSLDNSYDLDTVDLSIYNVKRSNSDKTYRLKSVNGLFGLNETSNNVKLKVVLKEHSLRRYMIDTNRITVPVGVDAIKSFLEDTIPKTDSRSYTSIGKPKDIEKLGLSIKFPIKPVACQLIVEVDDNELKNEYEVSLTGKTFFPIGVLNYDGHMAKKEIHLWFKKISKDAKPKKYKFAKDLIHYYKDCDDQGKALEELNMCRLDSLFNSYGRDPNGIEGLKNMESLQNLFMYDLMDIKTNYIIVDQNNKKKEHLSDFQSLLTYTYVSHVSSGKTYHLPLRSDSQLCNVSKLEIEKIRMDKVWVLEVIEME